VNPDRSRVEELWTRAAAGDPLTSAEEAELLRLAEGDRALRGEMIADQDLERMLAGLGRAEADGSDFVRSLTRRLDLERDGSRFARRVEQGLSRRRRRHAAPPRGDSFGFPGPWAAAAIFVLILAALAVGPDPAPERRTVQAPTLPAPEPATPTPAPPEPVPPPVEQPPVPPIVDDVRPAPPRPLPEPPDAAPPRELPAPPAPAPEPAKPVETRTAVAIVESVDGAASGVPILPGQEFTASGLTVIRYADGTRLEMARNTKLAGLTQAPGKRIGLLDGAVKLDVPRQPSGQPLVVATPQADVTVLGTRFTVTSSAGRSRVDVEEGRVRLRRLADRAVIDVPTGHYAVVAPGTEYAAVKAVKFLKGVNFNGPAVTIDGRKWMSHDQAVADGLALSAGVELFSGAVTPRPAVSAETASMLNTSVFRQKSAFSVAWPMPNGTYDVYFWVMENVRDNHRRFDAALEGVTVLRDAGRGAVLGEWGKLGPFRVTVQDGALNIDLIPRKTDAHLMGLAVFEAP
jgi:hypothetical protein